MDFVALIARETVSVAAHPQNAFSAFSSAPPRQEASLKLQAPPGPLVTLTFPYFSLKTNAFPPTTPFPRATMEPA